MRARKIRNPNNNIIANPFESQLRETTRGTIDLTTQSTTTTDVPAATPFQQTEPVRNARHVRVVTGAPGRDASQVRAVSLSSGHNAPHVGVVNNAQKQNELNQNAWPHMMAVNNANTPQVSVINNAQFFNSSVGHLALRANLARLHEAYHTNQPNPYVSLPLWGTPQRKVRLLRWTDAEDTFLLSIVNHSPLPWAHVMKVLPHRTKPAVMQRLGMLKTLTKNVRKELDLVLARKEVEVIVIDDDGDNGTDGVDEVRSRDLGHGEDGSGDGSSGCGGGGGGGNCTDVINGTGGQRVRVQHENAAVIQDAGKDTSAESAKSAEGGRDTVGNGREEGAKESVDGAQQEMNKKAGERILRNDDILEVCQRAVNVEHIPDHEEREESDDEVLIGAQRVAEVLNKESDDEMELEEEFVFVAKPRIIIADKDEILVNREKGEDRKKAEDSEKAEEKTFIEHRKRENMVVEYEERKRRKKDEIVAVS